MLIYVLRAPHVSLDVFYFPIVCTFILYHYTIHIVMHRCDHLAGKFLGDQRLSYNQDLTFRLRLGEEQARASILDVVIEGDGLMVSAPIYAQVSTPGFLDRFCCVLTNFTSLIVVKEEDRKKEKRLK